MGKLIKLENIRAFFIKHWAKEFLTLFYIKSFIELGRDFYLSFKNPDIQIDINEVSIILLSYALLLIIAHQLEKYVLYKRITESHYPKSYIVVKNKILPEYAEKSKSSSFQSSNNKRDKIIKSPIDYTYETLSGNEAPSFLPNEKYLEEIFEEDNKQVISLTSENPNMWLDPTLNFYLINTLAVSLLRKFNSSGKTKLIIRDFSNQNGFHAYVKTHSTDLLNKLANFENAVSFEFIRFFLFTDEQNECLKDTIFPSLRASQDLFRSNSFFINKDKFHKKLSQEDYELYKSYIMRIWGKIKDSNNIDDRDSVKIIERRIKEEIPEFLLLYKSNQIIIHTYINNEAVKTIVNNVDENGINYFTIINKMVSLLAKYAKDRLETDNCDWYPKETKHLLNSKNSYIDWE